MAEHNGDGLDRRAFLKVVGCGGCAMALSAVGGCTIAEVFDMGTGALAFDIKEPRFQALATVDGAAAVDVVGRPVLLIRTDEQTVVALNRICTHTQCDMAPGNSGRWDGEKLICTCHDTHFSPEGKVLKGPATRDLTTYPVEFDAGTGRGSVTVGGTPIDDDPVPEAFRGMESTVDPADPDVIAAGKTNYEAQACGTCHGQSGEGNDDLPDPKPTRFDGDNQAYRDDYLFWRIRTGRESGPDGSYMTAYGPDALNDEEVWQVIAYLRSLGT